MALNRHVVRCIGDDYVGPVLAHQRLIGTLFEGVAAVDPMRTQSPEITRLAYRLPRLRSGHLVIGIGLRRRALNQQIDLADLEPGDIEAEVEIELGELAQLFAEEPVVPG